MSALIGLTGCCATSPGPLLERMHAALRFRGDHLSSYCTDCVALGASRHDHESGPFLVSDESGGVIAACEGELYNSKQLAAELQLSPATQGFAVVPELYVKRGRDFPRQMNGVFTVALFDIKTRALHLVRDHAGSHSVFYHQGARGEVQFATTVRALLATGLVESELSEAALDAYFAGLAVSPPETAFKTIFTVRPGHMAVIRDGSVSEHCYWPFDAVTEDRVSSESHLASELRELFLDAVRIRAVGGGTHGTLVSGGVDTTAIAAVLSQETRGGLDGFSIAFEEHAYSDASLQDQVYRDFTIREHRTVLRPLEFQAALVQGIEHLDSPVNDVAYAGMYRAMDLVKGAGLHAVFDGEGADEIFCTGHSRGELFFQKYLLIPEWLRRSTFGAVFRSMPVGGSVLDKARRFGCRLGMPRHERLSTWAPIMPNLLRRRLHPRSAFMRYPYVQTVRYLAATRLEDPLNQYNYLLSRLFLPDDLLFKNERMAAAHGIINRTPFIDYRLMELGFRVPARLKLRKPTPKQDMTKLILKRAMAGIVPETILSRKKARGFSQPTSLWYRHELRDFVAGLLLSGDTQLASHLDSKEVSRLCHLHLSGTADLDYHLNSLVVLELWMRSHLQAPAFG